MFKKLRLWLIKRLHAIPEERAFKPTIIEQKYNVVPLELSKAIDFREEEYIDFIKKSMISQIGSSLEPYTEFKIITLPDLGITKIVARLDVVDRNTKI